MFTIGWRDFLANYCYWLTEDYHSSFEVDTLEIVLHELSGLVDIFFLIEADTTHKGVLITNIYLNSEKYFEIFLIEMKKPLIWELVRDTPRFQFMSGERVEHVVINMTSLDKIQDDIWLEHFTNTHKSQGTIWYLLLAGTLKTTSGLQRRRK